MPSSSTLRSQPPNTGIQKPNRTMRDSIDASDLWLGDHQTEERSEPDDHRQSDEPRRKDRDEEDAIPNSDRSCGESGDVEDRVGRDREREEHGSGQQRTLGDSMHTPVARKLGANAFPGTARRE